MKQMEMRISIILALLVISFSCSKDAKLSKPCTLNFLYNFEGSTSNGIQISSGSFYLDKVEFEGSREEGSNVDIEKKFNDQNFTFTSNSVLPINMDIPIGSYTNSTLEFRFRTDENSAFTLNGNVLKNLQNYPLIINFSYDFEIEFDVQVNSELEKDESYNLISSINLTLLFQQITEEELNSGELTSIGGVDVFLIDQETNSTLFQKIQSTFQNSFSGKIQ
jgi:hypothetical protein